MRNSPHEDAARDHDSNISDLLDRAEITRHPSSVVTALRLDLDIQTELEAAAADRGVAPTTLMCQIVEAWVRDNRDAPALNHVSELVRHLDAACQAAGTISRDAA